MVMESRPLLDLNRCSKEQLLLIPGVERAVADAVIRYRTKYKRYRHFDDVLKVDGMNRARYNLLKRHTNVVHEQLNKINRNVANEAYMKLTRRRYYKNGSILIPLKGELGEKVDRPYRSDDSLRVTKQKSSCSTPMPTGGRIRKQISPSAEDTEAGTSTLPPSNTRYTPVGTQGTSQYKERCQSNQAKPPCKDPTKAVMSSCAPDVSVKPSSSGKKLSLWCTFDEQLLKNAANLTIKWNLNGEKKEHGVETLNEKEVTSIDKISTNRNFCEKGRDPTQKERLEPIGCAKDEQGAEKEMVAQPGDEQDRNSPVLDLGGMASTSSEDVVEYLTPAPLCEENLLHLEKVSKRRWWDKQECIKGWVLRVNSALQLDERRREGSQESTIPKGGKTRHDAVAVKKNVVTIKGPSNRKAKEPYQERNVSPHSRTCFRLLRRSKIPHDEVMVENDPVYPKQSTKSVDPNLRIKESLTVPVIDFKQKLTEQRHRVKQWTDCNNQDNFGNKRSRLIPEPTVCGRQVKSAQVINPKNCHVCTTDKKKRGNTNSYMSSKSNFSSEKSRVASKNNSSHTHPYSLRSYNT